MWRARKIKRNDNALAGIKECLKRAEKTSGGVVLTINNLNFNLIIYVHIFNMTESFLDESEPRGAAGVVRSFNLNS